MSRSREPEVLKEELMAAKKKLAKLSKENTSLRTQAQRLEAIVKKKEAAFNRLMEVKLEKLEEAGVATAKVKQLRKDVATASTLNDKIRELESQLASKDEELSSLKSSLKLTDMRELQVGLVPGFIWDLRY